MGWEFFTKDGTVKKSGGSGGSPVVFRGKRSTDAALSAGYSGPIGFDVVYDTDGWFTGSRFTPKKAGYYRISATFALSGLGTGVPELFLRKNTIVNTPVFADTLDSCLGAARSDGWTSLTVTGVAYLNGSTDFVEVTCWMSAGGGTLKGTVAEATTFQGESISVQGADGPMGVPPRVTALPTSPVDGQEVYYVADATNGVLWHLKYNAGSASAYKWECVGGSPLFAEATAGGNPTSTSYAATPSGPDIALPLAGDYDVTIGLGQNRVATTNALCYMSYAIGATAAVDADSVYLAQNDAATPGPSVHESRTRRKTGLGAVTLASKYRVSAGVGAVYDRWMRVMPVRVG